MTLRFTGCVSLLPGLRANLSKSGVSLSIAGHGAWYAIGLARPARDPSGIPGDGALLDQASPADSSTSCRA